MTDLTPVRGQSEEVEAYNCDGDVIEAVKRESFMQSSIANSSDELLFIKSNDKQKLLADPN